MVVTHSLAGEDGDRTGMKHAIVFTLINFSMKLQKDEQVRVSFQRQAPESFFMLLWACMHLPVGQGDVHVHTGYNTLWDAVIN